MAIMTARSPTPSMGLTPPPWTMTPKRMTAATASGASRLTVREETASGMIAAPIPSISDKLATFEPMTLPIATSGSPSTAASTETRISGALVPNPTITTPTTIEGTLRITATLAAPRTNWSADHANRPILPMTAKMASTMTFPYGPDRPDCPTRAGRGRERHLASRGATTCARPGGPLAPYPPGCRAEAPALSM